MKNFYPRNVIFFLAGKLYSADPVISHVLRAPSSDNFLILQLHNGMGSTVCPVPRSNLLGKEGFDFYTFPACIIANIPYNVFRSKKPTPGLYHLISALTAAVFHHK